MIDSYQLEALEAIVREGSFQKASARLGLSQPAVSERIRLLESSVGQPVVIRGNPIRVTAFGQRLINHFQHITLLERSLLKGESAADSGNPVAIPVAVNFDSLATWFIPAVSAALEAGDSLLEIHARDQAVTLAMLREGRVLACVTSEKVPPSGCRSFFLGKMVYVLVASRSFYARRFSRQIELRELLAAPAVIYGWDDKLHEKFLLRHFKQKLASPTYTFVPHISAMREMVVRGHGYALLPQALIEADLGAGILKDVLPGRTLAVSLYWQYGELSAEILKPYLRAIESFTNRYLERW